MDCLNLAAILQFLEAHPSDPRAQRVGLQAMGRLARDEAQVSPLCLAAAAAVVGTIRSSPENLGLQRLAVAVLGSLAYLPAVAPLIAHEAVPAVFSAMVAHPCDEKIQSLACEALARLAQAGEAFIVKKIVQAMLSKRDKSALKVCCAALARLRESELLTPELILNVLLPLAESQPSHIALQHRAACALQWLVRVGAVGKRAVQKAGASWLLSAQWAELLARFEGADSDEQQLNSRFHADVQALFHEEVSAHFEYEAAERCLHLHRRGAPGPRRLEDVVRCLVENLEDYKDRAAARGLAWDQQEGKLVPLDAARQGRLVGEALDGVEFSLIDALKAAAVSGPCGEDLLLRRTAHFRCECAVLLDRKTEATQMHQEQAMEYRREVMLFEAVEYLELQAAAAGPTQIRTALHMLDMVAPVAPPDAIEALRPRLDRLALQLTASAVPRVPG